MIMATFLCSHCASLGVCMALCGSSHLKVNDRRPVHSTAGGSGCRWDYAFAVRCARLTADNLNFDGVIEKTAASASDWELERRLIGRWLGFSASLHMTLWMNEWTDKEGDCIARQWVSSVCVCVRVCTFTATVVGRWKIDHQINSPTSNNNQSLFSKQRCIRHTNNMHTAA